MKLARLLPLAAFALVATACADGAQGDPVLAGSIAVMLDAPDDSTGALVLSISGGPVDSVVSPAGVVHSGLRAGENSGSVLITGMLPGNTVVARIFVPAAAAAGTYQVNVVEAANRISFAQRTVSVRSQVETP